MSAKVLFVHGAFHGAWCWEKVAAIVDAAGTPTESVELYRGSREDDVAHVQSEVDRLGAEGAQVVLVGHSMGGIAITGVKPKSVAHLVYVAALLPGIGGPSSTDAVLPLFHESSRFADGEMHIEPSKAEALFYHDCTPEDVQWAISKLRPNAAYGGDDDASDAAWRSAPTTYIVCTDDRVFSVDYQRKAAALTTHAEDLSTSHSPMLSAPDLLAGALQRVVARIS